ncbi:type II toxin-antitoxin system PemK/MazF family toxin [Marinoscillum furvescens]|uniref:mRNA interferase MazF n=1 Tax=Marinoscillum furvescens DSM 4134 TaxID=1122208 RepID=A0A3D9L591_MARFU|nr:type II toxin-antitoxin system PemK/MazF family toxin [Marinoscillum furvescens]REE01205.1 mRNA interferase MazF [Marinoscillum furvescens DSM 4134]
MKPGDLILIPFPFTDLTGVKERPALVLANNNTDITVCFISSKTHWNTTLDLKVTPSTENGLKKPSIIRVGKIATLSKSIASGLLGNLSNEDLLLVKHTLRIYLGL